MINFYVIKADNEYNQFVKTDEHGNYNSIVSAAGTMFSSKAAAQRVVAQYNRVSRASDKTPSKLQIIPVELS